MRKAKQRRLRWRAGHAERKYMRARRAHMRAIRFEHGKWRQDCRRKEWAAAAAGWLRAWVQADGAWVAHV